MTPVTDNCPKPLVKLHGKPMIETTIETLQRRDINDITIVVGKLKEKFNYLIEKYNVTLIYNKDWIKRIPLVPLRRLQKNFWTQLLSKEIHQFEMTKLSWNIFKIHCEWVPTMKAQQPNELIKQEAKTL